MTPRPPVGAPVGAPSGAKLLLSAATLLATIAIAYGNSLASPFQFDDWWAIVGNDAAHSLQAWREALPGIRPLLKLANALNWTLAPTPAGFRIVNIAVHGANALLLWSLLRSWLPRLAPRSPRPAFAAFALVLLFALHPAATEAVTYISGRSIALAFMLQLATLHALTAAADGRRGAELLAALLFAAALAVRETAVVTPLAWLLLARCAGLSWRAALLPLRALGVVGVLALVAIAATPGYHSFFGWSLDTRGLVAQLLGQLDAHLYLLTRPLPGRVLDIDPDVRVPAAFAVRHVLLLAAAAAVAIVGWRQRRTRPWLLFALGWYVLQLAPSNSLLPRLDLVNDRHLYAALPGPLLVVALACAAIRPHWLGNVAVLVLAVAAGARTVQRNGEYRSELALWQATVTTSPGKARPWTNLGHARQLAGDEAGAAAAYRCALALDADYEQAAWNLAALPVRDVAPDRDCRAAHGP
jgi:tetratricopeptide (TPR) repeat protein